MNDRDASTTRQSADAVLMIAPGYFGLNPDTAVDNALQANLPRSLERSLANAARREAVALADALRVAGVTVHLFDDLSDETPDAIFPNNWISTHHDGRVVLYPMMSRRRRLERRPDILTWLRRAYDVSSIVDLTRHEDHGEFLEGTGALVCDHRRRIAYVALSSRAQSSVVHAWCHELGYHPHEFRTATFASKRIYHTNVMLSIGTEFTVACLELVEDVAEREALEQSLLESGRSLVSLSVEQFRAFAGNCFELVGSRGPIVAMSSRARASLSVSQRARLESLARIVHVDLSTVELSGGSARCMITALHLRPRR